MKLTELKRIIKEVLNESSAESNHIHALNTIVDANTKLIDSNADDRLKSSALKKLSSLHGELSALVDNGSLSDVIKKEYRLNIDRIHPYLNKQE